MKNVLGEQPNSITRAWTTSRTTWIPVYSLNCVGILRDGCSSFLSGQENTGLEWSSTSTTLRSLGFAPRCVENPWCCWQGKYRSKSSRFPLSSPAALAFCREPHLCFRLIIVLEGENQTRARAGGEESPEEISVCSWVTVLTASATSGHLPELALQQSKSTTNLVWGKGEEKRNWNGNCPHWWHLHLITDLLLLGQPPKGHLSCPLPLHWQPPSFRGKPKQRSTARLQKFTKSFTKLKT